MKNYGGIPKEFSGESKSPIVILPVSYDGTSTWLKGSDKGPEAILEASANMELYDIESDTEIYRQGIFTAPFVKEKKSPERMFEAVYKETKKYLDKDKFVVTIGGEHSVSIGAIKAHSEKYKDICVLQLDAHSDMRESYEGSKYNHACAMARAKEYASVIQVGIRSMDADEKPNIDPKKIFFAENIRLDKVWVDKVISVLCPNVYISIDLDVFDPSIIPSTGTPEPGGLGWYDVLDLMVKVNEKLNIIGFDVVELCPNPANRAPDFLASKLIYKILTYRFNKQK
jgi:agmatinase